MRIKKSLLVLLAYCLIVTAWFAVSLPRQLPVGIIPCSSDGEEEEKIIYLTFDDGPGKYTPKLLDILKKYKVKATFFVVNTKYIDTLTRIAQEGHTIGIHSMTHNYAQLYAGEDAYLDDLYQMQQIIYEYTGITTTMLRFPGGSSNTASKMYDPGLMTRLTKLVEDLGLQYFDWNVASCDTNASDTALKVLRQVVRGISGKKYAVVLQHDTLSHSVNAVEQIIVWGLENGYTFLPLEPDSPGCHHRVSN